MHELGITQGIIERAREAAKTHGARKVTDVYVTMTARADFTSEAIEMYFDMLARDDDFFRCATLHFDFASVDARCLECGSEFMAQSRQASCPACSSMRVQLDLDGPMVQLTDIGVDE